MYILLILSGLWLPSHQAGKLYLKNGRFIPLTDGYEVHGRVVVFRGERQRKYQIPTHEVDFLRTHAPPKPIEKRARHAERIHQIPWDHPYFRDKTTTLRKIVITTADITRKPAEPAAKDWKTKSSVPTPVSEGSDPANLL